MKPFLSLVCITLCGFSAFAQMQSSPVEVSVDHQPLEKTSVFELIVDLDIPQGVHVYSSEDNFFAIRFEQSINLGDPKIILPQTKPYENFDGTIVQVFSQPSRIVVRTPYTAQPGEPFLAQGFVQFQGCSDLICYPPQKKAFRFEGVIPSSAIVKDKPSEPMPYEKGLWLGIIGAFIAGLLLSLTPCVYPMVGITVAIIGAKNATRKEAFMLTFLYILGLSIIYAIVGVAVALMGSAAASFFRSAWVLVPIGVLFVILGLSMFDVITIQTGSSVSAKLQKFSQRYKGSYIGTFLIGALSAFVVGPCVSGPIISLITFVATSGDIIRGFAYFFALAWGMGLILFVAGTASGALPKAGVWMERIKHTIGIVLIWAGFYFTRPFIGEALFMTASVVLLAVGLHTLGLISLPDGQTTVKHMVRSAVGALILGTVVFMQFSSVYEHAVLEDTPQKIDLEQVIASSDKPILLDFQAPWCTICKEIEESTLSKPSVLERLESFTMVKVDYDSNPHLVEKFNIIGPPAFIFLDAQGQQVGVVEVTGEGLEKRLFSFDVQKHSEK